MKGDRKKILKRPNETYFQYMTRLKEHKEKIKELKQIRLG
jgi:hypothetical protein